MGYMGSRDCFEKAKNLTEDAAINQLAEGLRQLSRAIEDDLTKLKRDLSHLESRIR